MVPIESRIEVSELRAKIPQLSACDKILLSGVVYTARDAAHGRMFQALEQGRPLPFELRDSVIYYAGPTPTQPGRVIGSCGPTTSGRMDGFTPRLMDLGLVATIGKGVRSPQVVEAIVRNGGIYLCALGGAGALVASCVKDCCVVDYEDLGCESIKRLTVRDLPLIVGVDSRGKSIFDRG
ncbi:FumA C-terminus/TtdB family hydratase beta subunit [Oscillospiraceae bacterium MB08-C2-2]|nr:FumA C-terminus/TtdB family hydratase beta subunit [Oscillospiraceae bacterium MB08-C2-2]